MRRRASGLLLVLLAYTPAATPQTNPRTEGGPKTLIVTYKCAASQRVAFRRYMIRSGLHRFAQWKRSSILSSYRVLFSRYVDNDNWDMMSIFTFPDTSAVSRWRDIEERFPAGLGWPGLSHVTSINTTPADLTRNDTPASDNRGVFLVVPYDYTVSTSDYTRYLDGYVVPQLEAWHVEGVLAHYELFIARYGAARPWSALLVLQYVDEVGLGNRDRVIAKVRDKLEEIHSWKSFAESKQSVRVEKQAIVSDELRMGSYQGDPTRRPYTLGKH